MVRAQSHESACIILRPVRVWASIQSLPETPYTIAWPLMDAWATNTTRTPPRLEFSGQLSAVLAHVTSFQLFLYSFQTDSEGQQGCKHSDLCGASTCTCAFVHR